MLPAQRNRPIRRGEIHPEIDLVYELSLQQYAGAIGRKFDSVDAIVRFELCQRCHRFGRQNSHPNVGQIPEIDLSARLKRPVGIVLKSELKGREEEVLGEMQPL